MIAIRGGATCHPTRRPGPDGLCRECHGLLATPDDPMPALVFRAEQRGGPVVPAVCGKCGGPWIDRGGYMLSCQNCGRTHHVTSTRIIRAPRDTRVLADRAWALKGTKKRWRPDDDD